MKKQLSDGIKDGQRTITDPIPSDRDVDSKPNVGGSMMYKALAVIIKTKDDKYFQVALNQEMCDCLFIDLKNYFRNDIIQVLPDEISGISFG